ncbi:MAG: GNAT family N-acetyltransferase [Candidatus Geothermarchaeales archaeon]
MRHVVRSKNADTIAAIRRYKPGDIEWCRALWVELTEWHRQIYQSPSIGGPDPGRHFDAHLSRVGPEHVWVAELDGRVVGMAGLIPGREEAELEPLVVSESHRGLGIGRQLAEAVIKAAREGGVRQLKVRPVSRNETAIRFFHKLGFDILGQVELFMDLGPVGSREWRYEERMAGRDFRV